MTDTSTGSAATSGSPAAIDAPGSDPDLGADPIRAAKLARRRRRLLVGFAVAAGLYLVGTFLNPGVVPRLSLLPEPASRGVWFESCNGAPGNQHTETWEATGPFWTRTEFHTLAGCIDQSVPDGPRPGPGG